jgi:hypothetical protein
MIGLVFILGLSVFIAATLYPPMDFIDYSILAVVMGCIYIALGGIDEK